MSSFKEFLFDLIRFSIVVGLPCLVYKTLDKKIKLKAKVNSSKRMTFLFILGFLLSFTCMIFLTYINAAIESCPPPLMKCLFYVLAAISVFCVFALSDWLDKFPQKHN